MSNLDHILKHFLIKQNCISTDFSEIAFHRALSKSILKDLSLSLDEWNKFQTQFSFLTDNFPKNINSNNSDKNLIKKYTNDFSSKIDQNNKKITELINEINMYRGQLKDEVESLYRYFDYENSKLKKSSIIKEIFKSIEEYPDLERLVKYFSIPKSSFHNQEAEQKIQGYTNFYGYSFGDNISLLHPIELSLLNHKITKKHFIKKLSEKTLVMKEFHALDFVKQGSHENPPLIICLDTSGSMIGRPEILSKALSFLLIEGCHKSKKPVSIINFSTEISVLKIQEKLPLQEIENFLEEAFHGGTDIRPALDYTLDLLNEPAYKFAHVLILSDFRVPKVFIKKAAKIKESLKNSKGRLEAIVFNQISPNDDLHIFDRLWHFVIDQDPASSGISSSQWKENYLP